MTVSEILAGVDQALHKQAAATRKPDTSATASYLDDDEQYMPVGLNGVMAATQKLLAVNHGLMPPDHRDAQQFKRYLTPDKLMAERVALDSLKNRRNFVRMAAHSRTLEGAVPYLFDTDVLSAFVGTPLASPLEDINPLQTQEQMRRVTQMGPGGIGSEDAVTPAMQNIHASQFGFLDPLSGPESSRIGVDARLAFGVRIGSDGQLYQQFKDRRTGKLVWKSPQDLVGRVVAFPA